MKEITTPITTNVTMYEATDGKQFSDKEDCLEYEKKVEDKKLYNKIIMQYDKNPKPPKIKNLGNNTFDGYTTNFMGCYTGGKENRDFFEKFLIKANHEDDVNFPNDNIVKDWNVPLYVAFDFTNTHNSDGVYSQMDIYFYNEEDVDALFDKKYEMLKAELTAMDLVKIKAAEQAN